MTIIIGLNKVSKLSNHMVLLNNTVKIQSNMPILHNMNITNLSTFKYYKFITNTCRGRQTGDVSLYSVIQ